MILNYKVISKSSSVAITGSHIISTIQVLLNISKFVFFVMAILSFISACYFESFSSVEKLLMNVYIIAVLKGRIASSCSSAGPERKSSKCISLEFNFLNNFLKLSF